MQLPLWITPVTLLLTLVGLLSAIFQKRRLNLLLILWLSVPFLGMLTKFRDVRYLLVSVVPLCVFSSAGSMSSNKKLRIAMRSLALAFILIFVALTAPIVQQEYYGVDQAALQIRSLGLEQSTILTNCQQIKYYLPNATLLYIGPNQNSTTIRQKILTQAVNLVLILHNARGAWPQIDKSTREFLTHEFDGYLSGGPSQFSWYEIFYSTPRRA